MRAAAPRSISRLCMAGSRRSRSAGAGVVCGRYPAMECGGLSQLNPFGAASVKATILAASLWQSIALFRLHFNWDSRAIWEGF